MIRSLAASLLLWLLLLGLGSAHEVRPAYLEIRETAPDQFEALWKVPAIGDLRLGIYVKLPPEARVIGEPHTEIASGAYRERWSFSLAGGLGGRTLTIDGLSATRVDVLVRVTALDGTTQTYRITPDHPELFLPVRPGNFTVASAYTRLGVEHILLGFDHLLFVLALLLLIQSWKRLLGAITAFTVAHSLSLAAATLGFVQVPAPPVEACIALSIVFLACELVRSQKGEIGLTEKRPWIVAFLFGLIHGLGFAGALNEIGLPQHAIPIALLFFNCGVELGQIGFIAVVIALAAAWRRLPVSGPLWTRSVAPYAIGATASYWLIERISGF